MTLNICGDIAARKRRRISEASLVKCSKYKKIHRWRVKKISGPF